MTRALGMTRPPDLEHMIKYPLSGASLAPTNSPVTIATNWYTSFDEPKLIDGSYHFPDVAKGESLGTVRGGHCTCLLPMGAIKILNPLFWRFYNQAEVGACEGFGHAKAKSLLDGKLYDAFWLYNEARRLEDNTGEGSTSRSVLKAMQTIGMRLQSGAVASQSVAADGPVETDLGIKTYRWTVDIDEVCAALGRPDAEALPLSNNWGEDAPVVTWLPRATLERLLREEGEADVLTDD